MTKLNKLIAKEEAIEKQIEIEKAKENQDFTTIKYKGKEFRLYIWENKQIKDFIYPKGFEMAKFKDLIELYDNDKITLGIWEPVFVKHFSTKQQSKEYCLSGVCLYGDLDLYSSGYYLADSNGSGRVLCVKKGNLK